MSAIQLHSSVTPYNKNFFSDSTVIFTSIFNRFFFPEIYYSFIDIFP